MMDSLADYFGIFSASALQGAAPCKRTTNILAALTRDASKIDANLAAAYSGGAPLT
jgi:hypothetical protein